MGDLNERIMAALVQGRDEKQVAACAKVDAWLKDKDAPPPEFKQATEELAALDYDEYVPRAKPAAKKLEVSLKDLGNIVAARRKELNEKKEEEKVVSFIKDSTPWPEAVDGAELARKIAAAYRRFIVFKNSNDAEVTTLWVFGSHLIGVYNVFPRLGFTAPTWDCGKSTALDVTEHLAFKAIHADNITTAVAFRIMAELCPTLMIDELDTFLNENPELNGVLNSGHKKNGQVFRMEKVNDQQRLGTFATYGAVAYAMIGKPSGAFFSRTIFIRLDRKAPDEKVEDFNFEENPGLEAEFTTLRRQVARWAKDHVEAVKVAQPETGNLSNRTRDNWRALLKIAHVIGGEWPAKILEAAGVEPPRRRAAAQERLLIDLKNIYHTRNLGDKKIAVNQLPTTMIVADLLMQEESGWRRYYREHDQIDDAGLADLLGEYQVKPTILYISKEQQRQLYGTVVSDKPLRLRGYKLDDLKPLFAKYVTSEPEEVEVSDPVPL